MIDIFRRAGWHVMVAGLDEQIVTASRGVRIVTDCSWNNLQSTDFEILALAGGAGGTTVLRKDPRIIRTVKDFNHSKRLIAAICAAPVVLHDAGILAGRNVTSHPSVAQEMTASQWIDRAVVVDENIVTAQGAGTAFEFALTVVEIADSRLLADNIARAICLPETISPAGLQHPSRSRF